MTEYLNVPFLADVRSLNVEVEQSADSPGVVEVTAWADDGTVVAVTWDEIACSVTVRCTEGGDERLRLERESANKITVNHENGQVEFRVSSEASNLRGQLVVRVGQHVNVTDALLKK